jgi:demethoxyubiquinone hydroxylase (CLK1/Coq7/Cat5 family)
MEIEHQMIEFMRPLFGDMAEKALENQKTKLGIKKKASSEDYKKIAGSIRDLCKHMAGEVIADKIYTGLMEILESNN